MDDLSVVIPTYLRNGVLLDTIRLVEKLDPAPEEILVVDQTPRHSPEAEVDLRRMADAGRIRWLRLDRPSIPRAMNVGLLRAESPIVLFLDDDIVPTPDLVGAHLRAQARSAVVAGQVLQPGEEPSPADGGSFRFSSDRRQWITGLMAGNFSIRRELACALGGMDENFIRAAYRFESEFADRVRASGERILFEPEASIRHLKVPGGGTRAYGEHLRTIRPGHAVGAYYYLLRSRSGRRRVEGVVDRMMSSIRTRHHLARPWWIPVTVVAEVLGFIWALLLLRRGPRFLNSDRSRETSE